MIESNIPKTLLDKIPEINNKLLSKDIETKLNKYKNESMSYIKEGDYIHIKLLLDNKLGYNVIKDIGLEGIECLVYKDNTSGEILNINGIIDLYKTSDGNEYSFLYSDDERYKGYTYEGDDNRGKKYGFFLSNVSDMTSRSLTVFYNIRITDKKVISTSKKDLTINGLYVSETDYNIIDIAYKNKIPTLLMGPTGCGKTTILKSVVEKNKNKLMRINLNGEITKEDLLGSKTLIDGNVVWVDGPLLEGLRKGYIILFDELNAALPEVLLLLQSLTESKDGSLGEIRINENNGELIIPHKDCRIFGTANPSDEYIGTKDFNPATLSRWIVIYISYLNKEQEIELLFNKYKKILTKKIITDIVKLGNKLRELKSKGDILYSCSTRDLEYSIQLIGNGIEYNDALITCICNKAQSEEERKIIKDLIIK